MLKKTEEMLAVLVVNIIVKYNYHFFIVVQHFCTFSKEILSDVSPRKFHRHDTMVMAAQVKNISLTSQNISTP